MEWVVPALLMGALAVAFKATKGLVKYVVAIAFVVVLGVFLRAFFADAVAVVVACMALVAYVTYRVIKRRRKQHKEREREERGITHHHYYNPDEAP